MSELRINLENELPKRCVKNRCSVFTYSWKWNTWYGFWHNIAQFFDNIGAAWQRATKGYCAGDLWNFDITLVDYLINTLTAFRNTTQSWNDRLFASYEEFIDYLDDIIDELEYARLDPDTINPLYEEWSKLSGRYIELEDEERDLVKRYNEEERSILMKQKLAVQKALSLLSEIVDDLWI
jgi:hypothetical protein